MSIIGPRPGLWNQDLLTAERDKYPDFDSKMHNVLLVYKQLEIVSTDILQK